MRTTFTVAGDMLVQRRIHKDSLGFCEISQYLNKSDVRFVNLETTIHRGEYYANQFSGGSCIPGNTLWQSSVNRCCFYHGHSLGYQPIRHGR